MKEIEQFELVKGKYSNHAKVGKFEIQAHWDGGAETEELNAIFERIVIASNEWPLLNKVVDESKMLAQELEILLENLGDTYKSKTQKEYGLALTALESFLQKKG